MSDPDSLPVHREIVADLHRYHSNIEGSMDDLDAAIGKYGLPDIPANPSPEATAQEATARFWAERLGDLTFGGAHGQRLRIASYGEKPLPEDYLSDHRTCARAFRWVLDCLDRRWLEAMRDPSRALAELAEVVRATEKEKNQ